MYIFQNRFKRILVERQSILNKLIKKDYFLSWNKLQNGK